MSGFADPNLIMRSFSLLVSALLALMATALPTLSAASTAARPFGLVIHGGAGAAITRENLPPALEAQYRLELGRALDAGYAVLAAGGTALDAVVAAIKPLEDSPLFNAGKGAVLNADGICELHASIMDGKTLGAGAVSGVQRVKNPITLARLIMEKSPHVMFTGAGAERFAELTGGIEFVPNSYFQTERRREELRRAQRKEKAARKVSTRPVADEPAD